MARLLIVQRLTGQLSNEEARAFEAELMAFNARWEACGVEVKCGVDIRFDAEPVPVPVVAEATPAEVRTDDDPVPADMPIGEP